MDGGSQMVVVFLLGVAWGIAALVSLRNPRMARWWWISYLIAGGLNVVFRGYLGPVFGPHGALNWVSAVITCLLNVLLWPLDFIGWNPVFHVW